MTLGKRIAQNRKNLGLTQDQLAEKLGITAQAVSKWENDQSCPDISVLPKLAEIFGITTDELLGCETQEKVHQAEVVSDDAPFVEVHEDNGHWEFHWDAGRRYTVGFAVWVLSLGLLLLADNLCALGAGFWGLAWPSFVLLVLGLFGSGSFSFSRLGFVLLGGYFLVDNLGFMPLDLTGKIIWPGLVILFGLSLLFDALKKPKKSRFRIHKDGKHTHGKHHSNCTTTNGNFVCDVSFGEINYLVKADVLQGGSADISFGELTVDLSGCQQVADNCQIVADCAFGQLNLLVPRCYRAEHTDSAAFACVRIEGQPDENSKGAIYVDANASFGEICIRYI